MMSSAVANIYEVARRAGVSTATVSRVLSQPSVVSPETRRKVMQAVEFLDYQPNSTAQNLRTLKTGKLLVTVPDISNPFFSLILQGIEDAAMREGYSVLVGDTQHDVKREERYALMLKRKEADGLIFLGHRLPAAAAERRLGRKEPPTAIFCFNDEMAMGVVEVARRLGVRVPARLSVVGFDDIRFARHMDPPLTTIAQPMRQIGEGTVRLLLSILAGGGDAETPESVT